MKLVFERKRVTVAAARGSTDAACCYEFALPADNGEFAVDTPYIRLTTGLDVTFLLVRQFTDNSLLVLYHAGDPVNPQFAVAEFDFDDTHISHIHDHGDNLIAAHADFHERAVGDLTATPPEEEPVKADGA